MNKVGAVHLGHKDAAAKGGCLRSPKRKIELVRKQFNAQGGGSTGHPVSTPVSCGTSGRCPTVNCWRAPDRDPTTVYKSVSQAYLDPGHITYNIWTT